MKSFSDGAFKGKWFFVRFRGHGIRLQGIYRRYLLTGGI